MARNAESGGDLGHRMTSLGHQADGFVLEFSSESLLAHGAPPGSSKLALPVSTIPGEVHRASRTLSGWVDARPDLWFVSRALLIARIVGTLSAIGVVLTVAAAVAVSPGTTKPFSDENGNPLPESIAEASMVEVGGVRQFVLIRGRDRSNPVVLFLHGGPGDAQSALFRHYNSALEDHFVVVNWDQRGAGRSFDPAVETSALTENQLLSDAHELTLLLRERFGDRRVLLAGHSWGSYLGMRLAYRHPEDYAAYVGMGQVSNQPESEALSFRYALEEAKQRGRSDAVRQLEEVGPPDVGGNYRGGLQGLGVQRCWVREFGGAAHRKGNLGALLVFGWPIATFREYRLRDKWNYFEAESRSMAALEDDLLAGNLMSEVTSLEVPLFMFQGRYDQQTVTALTRRYFDGIAAPHKEFVEFEQSAHLVPYEEPERFLREMVERVRPWATR